MYPTRKLMIALVLTTAATVAVAALLASIIPARRALGVDPISAVRGQ